MTQGPDDDSQQPPQPPPGADQPPPRQPGPPPPQGWQPPPQQGWHQPQPGQPQPGQQPPPGWAAQPGWGPPPGQPPYGYPVNPAAPYGTHPVTGAPYSDKSKIVAGVLQLVVPLGIGRFYIGDTRIGVAQLLVTIFTCGIGGLWPLIDGIMILVGYPRDAQGRPMKMS